VNAVSARATAAAAVKAGNKRIMVRASLDRIEIAL
jgi:hypothetical protein